MEERHRRVVAQGAGGESEDYYRNVVGNHRALPGSLDHQVTRRLARSPQGDQMMWKSEAFTVPLTPVRSILAIRTLLAEPLPSAS
jgi:hypothetical protein